MTSANIFPVPMLYQGQAAEVNAVTLRHCSPRRTELLQTGWRAEGCSDWREMCLSLPPSVKPSETPDAPCQHQPTQSRHCPPLRPTHPATPSRGQLVTGCKHRPFRSPHLRARRAQSTPAEAELSPRKRKSGLGGHDAPARRGQVCA